MQTHSPAALSTTILSSTPPPPPWRRGASHRRQGHMCASRAVCGDSTARMLGNLSGWGSLCGPAAGCLTRSRLNGTVRSGYGNAVACFSPVASSLAPVCSCAISAALPQPQPPVCAMRNVCSGTMKRAGKVVAPLVRRAHRLAAAPKRFASGGAVMNPSEADLYAGGMLTGVRIWPLALIAVTLGRYPCPILE